MSGVSSVLRRQLLIIRCFKGPHCHPHKERMFDAKLLSGSSLEADAMSILRVITPLDPKLHKGQAGKVAVIGGCREYTCAPYFAAISALRIVNASALSTTQCSNDVFKPHVRDWLLYLVQGADLSHVFCTKDAATVIKGYSPELIGSDEKVSVGDKLLHEVSKWMERFDCLVIGPGLGSVVKCAKQSNVPIVIDGDGLFLVTNDLDLVRGYPLAVLTPNVNEYKRLVKNVLDSEVNDEDSPGQLLSLAKSIGGVSVLREGKVDLISDGEAVHTVSLYGSPRRCGGQGDILSGSVAVFSSWARHKAKSLEGFPDERYKNPMILGCIAASVLLRKAALAAFEKNKRSTLTTDIIEHLGESLESICPAL